MIAGVGGMTMGHKAAAMPRNPEPWNCAIHTSYRLNEKDSSVAEISENQPMARVWIGGRSFETKRIPCE
jgi:hypothetical protein